MQKATELNTPPNQPFALTNFQSLGGEDFLVVNGGKIAALGNGRALASDWPKVNVVDCQQATVIPGLMNSHIHAPMGFFRDLGHGKQNMIETFLFPAEKSLTPELIAPLSYSYLVDALKSGTTAVAEHYYFSAGVVQALDRIGMRGFVGETIADLGGAFFGEDNLKRSMDLLKKWPGSSRVRPVLAPHAADTVSLKLQKEVAQIAKSENLHIHMHLSQSVGERERVTKAHGKSPVAVAAQSGLLGSRTIAVHLLTADTEDMKILADTGTTAGLCPSSQVVYHALAPVAEFFRHKIPVALGTDCAASGDNADMLAELKTAALCSMTASAELRTVPAATFLDTAIANPRRFWFGDPGLKVGDSADLTWLDRGIEREPINDLATNLVFSASSRQVRHVLVEGEWILFDRKLTRVSEDDLRQEYLAAVAEIQRRVFA
jgi:5-methylthioadenosine/S-adenosylhomocysteine deaminase